MWFIGLPISKDFIWLALRRSHIWTLVSPLLTAASQVPFSENEMLSIGPGQSKLAALAPDLTSNTLI
jgi:hypothetical protein